MVIAIIALLAGILVPAVAKARDLAKQVTCLTRVHGQLQGVHMYAGAHGGHIPTGPDVPMALPGGQQGPILSHIASSQLWVGSLHAYNVQAVLLEDYLPAAEMLYCPDDDSNDPVEELAKIEQRGDEDAYGSYLYRQLDARHPDQTPGRRIGKLGENPNGRPVRALILDMNSRMVIPGTPQRTNHRGLRVNVGFEMGDASTFDNGDDALTLRAGDGMTVFNRLDEIFTHADALGE